MGKSRPTTSKNEDHPLLNYLLESTTSKRWNNFVIINAKDLTTLFVVAMCFYFTPPHSSPNWQKDIKMQKPYPIPKVCIGSCTPFACSKTEARSLNQSGSNSSQSLSLTLGTAILTR
jgi:hypothetical protein